MGIYMPDKLILDITDISKHITLASNHFRISLGQSLISNYMTMILNLQLKMPLILNLQ